MAFEAQAFGRRLAASRIWAGLEPKQIARHLGVSAETVNRWERGGIERAPAKGQLVLLAELLHQDVDWLLSGEVPPWATAQQEDALSEGDLSSALARLTAELEKFGELAPQLEAFLKREDARAEGEPA